MTKASDLSEYYGKPWSESMAAPSEVAATMEHAGAGSRGLVFGVKADGEIGHFFNVANEGGVIHFVDGQIGGPAPAGRFDRFWLLRTN